MHLPRSRTPLLHQIACLALLSVVACADDSSADSPDSNTDALGAGDASTGSDGTASSFGNAPPQEGLTEPACDCDAEAISLECLCTLGPCPDLAAELGDSCEAGADGDPRITVGCGFIRSERGSDVSLAQRVLIYDAESLELVAGSTRDDVMFGACERSSYGTAIPEGLTECEALQDIDGCTACPGNDEASAASCIELP